MTPKQRFIDSMNFKKPHDLVAFMEIEFHIYKEYIGREPIIGYEFAKLSPVEKEKALYWNAEIMVETAEKAGHDAIKDINWYWEVAPKTPAYLWLAEEKDRLNQIRALKKVAGKQFAIVGSCFGTMCIPDGEQINDFVIDLFENSDMLKQRYEKMLMDGLELQEKLVDVGVDAILNPSDVAFNSGPFISPQHMDEFFFPYLNRWVENLNKHKVLSIWHTDGNILPIMDRTLQSKVSAIQCLDPLAGMDIVKIKKQLEEKLVLIGNIDCSLLHSGPAEKIEEEVKRVVEGCKGTGGFVLSGCNAIFKGIPPEHYQVMVDARRKYGKEN